MRKNSIVVIQLTDFEQQFSLKTKFEQALFSWLTGNEHDFCVL